MSFCHVFPKEKCHDPHEAILILGGTGKTGRRIAERLEAREIPVRVGSRSERPAFDWSDRATWAAALEGVGAIYVSYYPDLAVPGAADDVAALVDLAKASGVRRLVLLSGRGEAEAQACESVVMRSGTDWTILRCSWFNQNFSETLMADMVLAGEIALPAGEVAEPFIDAEDIADMAVAAFTDDRHIGQLYELTGPRLLTFAEVAAEISAATGRSIAFRQLTHEDFAAAMAAGQTPDDVAWLVSYLFREVLDGRNEWVADGVSRVLGRPARDFSDYARKVSASGAWAAAKTEAL
jgi:uncharacterized protein YbjT (DUF2867 family)